MTLGGTSREGGRVLLLLIAWWKRYKPWEARLLPTTVSRKNQNTSSVASASLPFFNTHTVFVVIDKSAVEQLCVLTRERRHVHLCDVFTRSFLFDPVLSDSVEDGEKLVQSALDAFGRIGELFDCLRTSGSLKNAQVLCVFWIHECSRLIWRFFSRYRCKQRRVSWMWSHTLVLYPALTWD